MYQKCCFSLGVNTAIQSQFPLQVITAVLERLTTIMCAGLYALRQKVGAVIWRYAAADNRVLSTAASNGKNIYIGTSDAELFFALDKKTGK